MRKKILIKVTNNATYTSSSGELVTLGALINILKTEYEIKYYGTDHTNGENTEYQVENLIKNKFQMKYSRRLMSIFCVIINSFYVIVRYKPDLLMCIGGVYYNGLCITLLGKLFGIPSLVRTAEDHYRVAKLQESKFYTLIHKLVILPLSHFTLKQCTYPMTVGYNSARYLQRILQRKVYWCPSPFLLNASHSFDDKSMYKILYVGTLNKVKGSLNLYQFVSKALSENPTWNFLFVGTDKSREQYIQKLKNKYPSNVKLKKPIKNESLSEIYKKCEVLIFTTRVGIGYGLVTLEAMSQGCRVIAILPKLDVKALHGSNTIDSGLEKLESGQYSDSSKYYTEHEISNYHLDFFKYLLPGAENSSKSEFQ